MASYTIITDSGSDVPRRLLEGWDVGLVPLAFSFDGIADSSMANAEFYGRMRAGQVALTSAPSVDAFEQAFCTELDAGRNVLYLGVSTGISCTSCTAELAAQMLRGKYPRQRVVVVDTLCASVGLGLLVGLCAQQRARGASLDEAARYVRQTMGKVCHWFTVDSLVYLRRGGRIGALSSAFASFANIKPVMHMGADGKLAGVSKVRGRRRSISALADMLAKGRPPEATTPVYIGHCDCADDAALLASTLEERCGVAVSDIWEIGPVIGAHSGPGTLALFYLGDNR